MTFILDFESWFVFFYDVWQKVKACFHYVGYKTTKENTLFREYQLKSQHIGGEVLTTTNNRLKTE